MASQVSTQRGDLIFIKLGGSLITDKSTPYTAKRDVIDRLCDEIHLVRQRHEFGVLVGHGSGSFGHVSATHYQTNQGAINANSWEGFVRVHDDAAKLNAIVCESFARAGELGATLQPSSAFIARCGRIEKAFTQPIALLLEARLIPVLYGDVCVDEERGMCIISTEEIFRFLAAVLHPRRIVLVGKVDGVLDRDGQVIPSINSENFETFSDSFRASDGVADVTGGMLHKVQHSLQMGVPTQIINGLKPGLLAQALRGESVPGTVIEA